MEKPVNCVRTSTGRVSAVCRFCGTKARSVEPNDHGEPDLFRMAKGWSEAPYFADTVHRDGSTGSRYSCPSCNKKLKAGDRLQQGAYLS